ncbi:MAG: (d)CMP kinase [bacterium]
MLIAIDGPAGAGKSTTARGVAAAIGGTYLDSGAMYRCVALAALGAGVDLDDPVTTGELAAEVEVDPGPPPMLDGEDVSAAIRTREVSEAASRVSVHPEVRAAMVGRQRELITDGIWVAEGRDIGTVVAPDAELKIFLTADRTERARRRAVETGDPAEGVARDIAERDRRDTERDHGALVAADDAVELDTTGLDPEQVVERIIGIARERNLV